MRSQDEAKFAVMSADSPAGWLPGRADGAASLGNETWTGGSPIDGYQIISRLGSGGMGTVWRAWQSLASREVALKLLNHGCMASERARRRFEREVELTARLSHPNIARLYDSGIHNGACYYAMELIDGETLDKYVDRRQLPVAKILELFATICQAVQHAHQNGIIHRDLKPSNIIVDAQGQPHVLDFGLAKIYEVNDAGSAVSLEGEVMGTPAFMSPEQAEGAGDAVDTRTDVYSLGAVLYFLLAGRTPHDTSGTYLDVLRRVTESEITRPRNASPRIDPDLDAILLKALARDVESRYASPGLLADDLRNYLNGDLLIARKRTAVYFLRKKLWKHRIPAGAVLAVVATLAGLSVYGSIRIRRERDAAVTSAAKERQENRLAQIRLADNLLLLGDNLGSTDRWDDARQQYWAGRDIRAGLGVSTTAIDYALLDAYRKSPAPLNEFHNAGERSFVAGFGPDRRTVYCAGEGGVTTAWDLLTGRKLFARGRPHGVVKSAAFTPDGKKVVYAMIVDGAARIEVQDNVKDSPARTFPVRPLGIMPITVSADGSLVAYRTAAQHGADEEGNTAGFIDYCYHLDGNVDPMRLNSDRDGYCIFSSHGTTLLLAAQGGTLATWNPPQVLSTSKFKGILPDDVSAISPAPDGNGAVVGQQLGLLSVWNANGDRNLNFAGHSTAVTKLALSPDGKLVLSGDADGQVKLWNALTGSPLGSEDGHQSPIVDLEFATSGKLALATAQDGGISLLPVADHPENVARLNIAPTCLALSPDGDLVAAGLSDGGVALLDAATGNVLHRVKFQLPAGEAHGSPSIESIAFTSDGQDLCVAHAGWVDRIHIEDFSVPDRLHIAPSRQNTTQLNSDGRIALNFGHTGASVWDSAVGKETKILAADFVHAAAISADGKAALISQMGSLRLVELETGREIAVTFNDPGASTPDKRDSATSCALSADGRLAMIGDSKGNVILWDPYDVKGLRTLGRHSLGVRYVGFAPESGLAASGSDDGTVKLWDLNNRRELRTLYRGTPGPMRGAFGRGSQFVFSRPCDGIKILDPAWPARHRKLAELLRPALETLGNTPDDPRASARLGEWYAFRNQPFWAAELLEKARAGGVDRSGLELARCYWKLGDNAKAADEFAKLLGEGNSPRQKLYLTLCEKAAREGSAGQLTMLWLPGGGHAN